MDTFRKLAGRTKFWLFVIFVLSCTDLALAEKWSSPVQLVTFWSGINPRWMPATEDEYWKESDRKKVIEYCEQFATKSSASDLLPVIVGDLKAHPSVIRTFVYTWLVMNWNETAVISILNRYYTGSDSEERRVAGDFIAAIEENRREKNP